MKFAYGNSRMDKRWKNKDIPWETFKDAVRTTKRTTETVSEFRKMSKAQQDAIKDIGGFVGGELREGKRRNGYVVCRSLLTLDMDYAQPGIWDQIDALHDWACCLYSTHKHTPEAPRLRLLIPLKREVTEDEYPALGRMVAKEIGIEGASGMRKSELIAAIKERRADSNGTSAPKNGTAEAVSAPAETASAPAESASAPAEAQADQAAEAQPRRRERRGASREQGGPTDHRRDHQPLLSPAHERK